MTKEEWRIHHGFTLEELVQIELALSISEGNITAIFDKPLDYQDIKISMKIY